MNAPSKKTGTRRPFVNDRGQAMTEAAIMLALLGFTWALFGYAAFMTGNGIRSVAASRHMAWMKGNGLEPSQVGISTNFYGITNYVTMAIAEREIEAEDPLSDSPDTGDSDTDGVITDILAAVILWAPPVWACEARYGIDGIDDADQFPFSIMKTTFPYMPESQMTNFFRVEGHCEWERVNETWDSPGDVFEAIWDGIMSSAGL